jgi:hypothetical protein
MAYVTAGKGGCWEIRESRSTEKGPRSRTLTTFGELTPQVVERASERAASALDSNLLVRSARRAGAPVAMPSADGAARALLSRLSAGEQPRPVLRRLLLSALGDHPLRASDAVSSAAQWLAADGKLRAETLWDLLLLADRLPPSRRERDHFPVLDSTVS